MNDYDLYEEDYYDDSDLESSFNRDVNDLLNKYGSHIEPIRNVLTAEMVLLLPNSVLEAFSKITTKNVLMNYIVPFINRYIDNVDNEEYMRYFEIVKLYKDEFKSTSYENNMAAARKLCSVYAIQLDVLEHHLSDEVRETISDIRKLRVSDIRYENQRDELNRWKKEILDTFATSQSFAWFCERFMDEEEFEESFDKTKFKDKQEAEYKFITRDLISELCKTLKSLKEDVISVSFEDVIIMKTVMTQRQLDACLKLANNLNNNNNISLLCNSKQDTMETVFGNIYTQEEKYRVIIRGIDFILRVKDLNGKISPNVWRKL